MSESDDDKTIYSEWLENPLTPALPERPRFEFLALLGKGGMGEVWRVRDQRLARTIALKKSHRNQGGLRFIQEAEIAAQLQHPGILPVYEMGTGPEGELFFTMREVSGQALRHLLDTCTPVRLVSILIRVCEAIAYAHQQGVIHRDLKPDNIMVGEFGEVVVIDWGVAMRLGAPDELGTGSAGHRLTLNNIAVGTIGYMPPEQASGDRARVGRHSDVFAIGAILYEGLVGRRPFPDIPQTLEGALTVPDTVPRELAVVLSRALALAPAERFERVEDLGADLQAWLDERPLSSVQYNPAHLLLLWGRRHRGLLSGGGAVLALAAVLFVVGATKYVRDINVEVERAHRSELRAEQALAQSELSEGLALLAAERLDEARPPLRRARARLEQTGQSAVSAQLALWVADSFSPPADEIDPPWPAVSWPHRLERSGDSEPDVVLHREGHPPLALGRSYAVWMNARWLVSASYFSTTTLWDLSSSAEHRALCPLRCRGWGSPDGERLAVYDEIEKVLRVEVTQTGEEIWRRPLEDAQAVSWAGDALVIGGDMATLTVLEQSDGTERMLLGGHDAPVRELQVHEGRLLSQDASGRVLGWRLPLQAANVIPLPIQPDRGQRSGDQIVFSNESEVTVFSASSRAATPGIALPPGSSRRGMLLKDSLWVPLTDNQLGRLPLPGGEALEIIEAPGVNQFEMRSKWANTGDAFLLETIDDGLALWSPEQGVIWHREGITGGHVWEIIVSGDRAVLSCWSAQQILTVDLQTGEPISTHKLPAAPYGGGVADNGRMAFGLADGTVALIAGETVQILQGHRGLVYDAAFSGDGTLLLSLAWGSEIRIWDSETAELYAEQQFGEAIFSVFQDGPRRWLLGSVKDGLWTLSLE